MKTILNDLQDIKIFSPVQNGDKIVKINGKLIHVDKNNKPRKGK